MERQQRPLGFYSRQAAERELCHRVKTLVTHEPVCPDMKSLTDWKPSEPE